jgi:hypothetical protein
MGIHPMLNKNHLKLYNPSMLDNDEGPCLKDLVVELGIEFGGDTIL